MTWGTTRAGPELMHGKVTAGIIGAFYDSYNELGFGYAESLYVKALTIELETGRLTFGREVALNVRHKGTIIGEFRADLIVDERVIVECKSVDRLIPAHDSHVINYLKSTGINVGLILNFGPKPSFRRLLFTSSSKGDSIIRA
jgi:GxxExxY protein